MSGAEEASSGRRVRKWRSLAEKRAIVQLTLDSDTSVAEVSRAHGVNANQVFAWRRAFERGELVEPRSALLPVMLSTPGDSADEIADEVPVEQPASGGSIHIELPGRANISIESGADAGLVRQVLESLRR